MQKELLNYIRKNLNKGISKQKIRTALMKAGHDKKTINSHLEVALQKKSNQVNFQEGNKNKIIFVSLGAILVIILVLSLLMLDPSPKRFKDKGWKLYDEGRYEEAIIQFREATELNYSPIKGSSYRGLAQSYHKLKGYGNVEDVKKTLEYFEKAVEFSNPEDNLIILYQVIGDLYTSINNFEKAEEAYNELILIKEDGQAYAKLARLYLNEKDIAKSKEFNKKAMELDPNYFLIYVNLGRYHFLEGEYDLAEENFLKSFELEEDPSHIVRSITLGFTYLEKEELSKAREYFELALEQKHNNCWPYTGMAYIEQKSGNNDKAKEYLNIAKKQEFDCSSYIEKIETELQSTSD